MMGYLISFFVFILGTLIGSFLNVVVLRYGTGMSVVNRGSKCFSCGKRLRWYELFPIFSFVFQRGRCLGCGSRISWQYAIVEIITGLIFLLVFQQIISVGGIDFFHPIDKSVIFIFAELVFYWTVFSLLIALSVYDMRHKIIPNGLVYAFIILSISGGFFFENFLPNSQHLSEVLGMNLLKWVILGFLIAVPFFAMWFLSRGRAMGFGDVKLALGIGLLLGLHKGLYALIWSFWIGGLFGIFLVLMTKIAQHREKSYSLSLLSKRFTMKSEIPFGPFLVLGTFLAFFCEWNFFRIDLLLNLFQSF